MGKRALGTTSCSGLLYLDKSKLNLDSYFTLLQTDILRIGYIGPLKFKLKYPVSISSTIILELPKKGVY